MFGGGGAARFSSAVARFLPAFDHAAEQRAGPGLPRNEVDIADQLRAAFPTFQRNLAAVEGLQFGAMCHAAGAIGSFRIYVSIGHGRLNG